MENLSGPIHVLQVLGRLDVGGVESRQMDLLRSLDKSRVQFDFMIHTKDHCAYEEEAIKLGANIYRVPRFKFYNILQYRKAWNLFFKEHPEIKIVHGHMTSTAAIYLPIAKLYGCYTIAHVRSAGVDKGLKGLLTKLLRHNLFNRCDKAFACSKLAAINVYGKKNVEKNKVLIFNNAINADKYEYNVFKRKEIRDLYGISDDEYLIGNVGRLDPPKNHQFMFEILQELQKYNVKTKLMLVGAGSLENELKEKVQSMGLNTKVIFAGRHSNIEDYYNAFDFFVLPSFYEGLPGAVIEAMASGLHGIISDRVTDECLITDLFKQMSIDGTVNSWVEEILKHLNEKRRSHIDEIKKAGFDVQEQIKWLEVYYEEKSVVNRIDKNKMVKSEKKQTKVSGL